MFYTFEMANNHMGSVSHSKKIIDEFGKLVKKHKLSAAIKLQFRQLETFIHKDYQNSDLKYVKRFNETKLTQEQFQEIVDYIKANGMKAMATPFDNESLVWMDELDIDVVKIASCSIDDWPLLEEVCKINKKIIISTAGADFDLLKKVYRLFKKNKRDFAFMHCVGEYPTPIENSNLNRIKLLQREFPDIEIGFSTHESPLEDSLTPYAVAMGCTIVEKHIGVPTDTISLNKYSVTTEYMEKLVVELDRLQSATNGVSTEEKASLKSLKRGMYTNKQINRGDVINREDVYFSMPVQEGQMDASNLYDVIGNVADVFIDKDIAVYAEDVVSVEKERILSEVKRKVMKLLDEANVTISRKDKVEISSHYGLENFFETGALIINKVNREYCKKIIVVLAGQSHPVHYHIQKEEASELLYGDCTLNMNGKDVSLDRGIPKVIFRGVEHSFRSKDGCVIEEVSTMHVLNDSKYQDTDINKLDLSDRKININLI